MDEVSDVAGSRQAGNAGRPLLCGDGAGPVQPSWRKRRRLTDLIGRSLDMAADYWILQSVLAASARVKQLERVSSEADQLLRALHKKQIGDALPAELRKEGPSASVPAQVRQMQADRLPFFESHRKAERAYRRALEQVVLLRTAARRAAEQLKPKVLPADDHARRRRHPLLDHMIDLLMYAYQEAHWSQAERSWRTE